MKTFLRFRAMSVLFSLVLLGSSCQKEEPAPTTHFTVFAQIDSKFDRLEVYIDDRLAGSLTTTRAQYPNCGDATSASLLTTSVSPGSHAIVVKQIYQNKEVGVWDDWTINFKEGECIRRRLTE